MQTKLKSLVIPALLLSATTAHSALISQFLAADWAGPSNNWAPSAGSATKVLTYETFGGSAPQSGTDTISGQTVPTVVFDGNDFFTLFAPHAMAGLQSFTVSVAFRSNTDEDGATTFVNDFWNYKGIAGFEVGGGGKGEFGIGIWDDGSATGAIGAGTGLAAADIGSNGGNINDDAWHTLSLVVTNDGGGLFTQSVYVDGSLTDSDSGSYGDVTSFANSGFALGKVRGGANVGFTGSVAAFQLDDAPLTGSEITALHGTYLGAIPEPGSALLAALGLLGLLRRRR